MPRKRYVLKIKNGLIPLFLGLLLTLLACGRKIEVPVVHNPNIPIILATETPMPAFNGKVNEDLIDYIITLQYSLERCNADKKAIYNIIKKEQ